MLYSARHYRIEDRVRRLDAEKEYVYALSRYCPMYSDFWSRRHRAPCSNFIEVDIPRRALDPDFMAYTSIAERPLLDSATLFSRRERLLFFRELSPENIPSFIKRVYEHELHGEVHRIYDRARDTVERVQRAGDLFKQYKKRTIRELRERYVTRLRRGTVLRGSTLSGRGFTVHVVHVIVEPDATAGALVGMVRMV